MGTAFYGVFWVFILLIMVPRSLQQMLTEIAAENEDQVPPWKENFITMTPDVPPTEPPLTDPTVSPTLFVETESPTSTPTHATVAVNTCGAKDPETGVVRPLRIMTSATDEYLPVFLNWLIYLHQVCPSVESVYLICLDPAIEKKLGSYGINCSHVHHTSGGHKDIWLVRTRLAHSLLAQGYDVLLSDADALWLSSPFPLIEEHLRSDIVSSRGLFPENVSKALGAALCMGFAYIKASAPTVALWGEAAAVMARQPTPDDQRDINNMLLTLGLHYPTRPTYIGSTEASLGYFQHRHHHYRIALLPHVLFRRICDQERKSHIRTAVVAHCLSHQKRGVSKMSTAEALGLWRLRKDWHRVTLQGDLQAYLDAIAVPDAAARDRGQHHSGGSEVNGNSTDDVVHGSPGGGSGGRTLRSLGERHIRGSADADRRGTSAEENCRGSSLFVGAEDRSTESFRPATSCMEYSTHWRLFRTPEGRETHSCWYVSPSAPVEVIRQFEELVSATV